MIASRQKLIDICDKLMRVHPEQIVIDFIQDCVEEVAHGDSPTPDDVGSLCYQCDCLLEIYNPAFEEDIWYLTELKTALNNWLSDSEFSNKALGIDPNK